MATLVASLWLDLCLDGSARWRIGGGGGSLRGGDKGDMLRDVVVGAQPAQPARVRLSAHVAVSVVKELGIT